VPPPADAPPPGTATAPAAPPPQAAAPPIAPASPPQAALPPPQAPATPPVAPAPPPVAPTPPPVAPAPPFFDRFSGSYLSWGNVLDNNPLSSSPIAAESDYYAMGISFTPTFFAYRSDVHQIRIRTSVSASVELTNSETTTSAGQLQLHGMPVAISDTITLASWGGANRATGGPFVAFDPTLAGGGENHTWFIGNAGVLLPTSRESQGIGRYLTTDLKAGLRQRIKLLGSGSAGLSSLTLQLRETWQHDFTRAVVATNPSLDRPRQTSSGSAILSDQLSGTALVQDRFIHSLSMLLPLYGDLQLAGELLVRNDLPYRLQSGGTCDVVLATGCIDTTDPEASSAVRTSVRFDWALAYQIIPELGIDAGAAGALGINGSAPNLAFYADLTFFPVELVRRVLTASPAAN